MTKKEMIGKLSAAIEVVKGLPDELKPICVDINNFDESSVLVWHDGMGDEAKEAFEEYANANGFALRTKVVCEKNHLYARHASGIDVTIVIRKDARVSATDELDAIIVGEGVLK